MPDLGNGWQIVNGEANYGDITYTSLSAYSLNGSAYIIPEEVKLASVDIRLDVIIPSGGLSANYQKVEIVIFDDIKNDYTEFLKFCAYYTNLVPRVMWQKINEIEKEIREKFPDIKHIDLEIN